MTGEKQHDDGHQDEEEVHGAVVGIINPPPDLRLVVDKTAMFVAKNGKKFEAKILAKNDQDVKFAFLKPTSPYHKYYLSKVDQFALEIHNQARKGQDEEKEDQVDSSEIPKEEQKIREETVKTLHDEKKPQLSSVSKSPKLKMMAKLTSARKTRGDKAPPPLTFILDHPNSEFVTLTAARVDLIRLTARFTAALGREFLSQVALREVNNPEFDFLKPTSSLFTYFTSYIDSYRKIIDHDKQEEISLALRSLYKDRLTVLDRCVHRVEYEQKQKEESQNEDDSGLGEKLSFLQLDWHDFVVVETIQFEDETAEEKPQKDRQAKKAIKEAQEKKRREEESVNIDVDMEMDVDMDVDMDQASDEEKIEVREDYKPKIKSGEERRKIVTLPDGRQIEADALNEHVRVELIDPAYKEQQKRHLQRKQNLPFAQKDISTNLAKLASHRPDVFGVDEDTAREVMKEDERRRLAKERVVWDGSTSTVAEVTMQAQQKLLQSQGMKPVPPSSLPPSNLSSPSGYFSQRTTHVPPPVAPPAAPSDDLRGQPAVKKQKTEAEAPGIQTNGSTPGAQNVTLQVPNDPDAIAKNWNLSGQVFNLSFPSADSTIAECKAIVGKILGDIPINKFQLKVEGIGFLKDKNTLASSGVRDGARMELKMKQRGRR